MVQKTSTPPKAVGSWTRPDAARIIDASNIFEYMNGAGELYLAYGFDRLEVYEYTSDQQDSILVELYFMKTSDDAFGLLSMDWGGEPIANHPAKPFPSNPGVAPPVRALYGGKRRNPNKPSFPWVETLGKAGRCPENPNC